ncbi:hypothetical protein BX666DRAFT_1982914 [Dichotomocladium elegans]|nr:hypothetical protein BX666DRAFT_1982914 [Dichotomocladium elegans]
MHFHLHHRHASSAKTNKTQDSPDPKVCNGRGKSYCLVHRRYFETSWCPDCSRSAFYH